MNTPLGSTTGPRPQPVLTAGLAAQAVSVLAFIVGGFGIVLTDDQQDSVTAGILGIAGLISVIAHLVAMFRARSQVTPTADPVDARGVPLVPADSYDGLEVPDITTLPAAAAAVYPEGGPDDLDDDDDPDDDPQPAP